MRIGILGGSFDPIHHGHLLVALVVGEELGLDRVLVVPAREQPFKVGQHRASPEHRLAMVELAVNGAAGLVSERLEIDREGPSYTADTITTLVARLPGAELFLLLGADAARLFPSWREPARIRAGARVVVFHREGEEIPENVPDRVVVVPRIDISSTIVRERVRSGRPIRYWVPDAVDQYIAAHGLYREA